MGNRDDFTAGFFLKHSSNNKEVLGTNTESSYSQLSHISCLRGIFRRVRITADISFLRVFSVFPPKMEALVLFGDDACNVNSMKQVQTSQESHHKEERGPAVTPASGRLRRTTGDTFLRVHSVRAASRKSSLCLPRPAPFSSHAGDTFLWQRLVLRFHFGISQH